MLTACGESQLFECKGAGQKLKTAPLQDALKVSGFLLDLQPLSNRGLTTLELHVVRARLNDRCIDAPLELPLFLHSLDYRRGDGYYSQRKNGPLSH